MTGCIAGSDRLLRISDVKSQVGLGKSKIYALIAEGRFPRPYRLSPKAARWSEREIAEWIAQALAGCSPNQGSKEMPSNSRGSRQTRWQNIRQP
jgi:prophage regulatory protein